MSLGETKADLGKAKLYDEFWPFKFGSWLDDTIWLVNHYTEKQISRAFNYKKNVFYCTLINFYVFLYDPTKSHNNRLKIHIV